MKKSLFAAALFLIQAACVCAFTADSGAPVYTQPYYLQAEYTEKYFEYKSFYIIQGEDSYYNRLLEGLTTQVMTGMSQSFRLSINLPEDYSAGISVLHVLQKMGDYNLNNFQSLTVAADRKIGDMFSVGAGIRVPLIENLPDDPRLLDYSDKLNLILRAQARMPLWLLRFYADVIFEQNLKNVMYKNEITAMAGMGVEVFNDPEKQKITLLCEAGAQYWIYGEYFSYIWKAVPQAVLSFNGGFDLVFSVDFLLDAYRVYANEPDDILFSVKANYSFDPLPHPKEGQEGGDDNSGGTTIYYPEPEKELE
ncbi:MAG: hypothetical protein JXR81_03335 [Candidatus Goldbacteria bacterium]|nr:hypothetical protein [Candidatus Goldiibacteriota bacterium]